LPVPLLREPPALIMKRRGPSGLDDAMAIAGFANSSHLAMLCGIWSRQLELLRPDVIVGFNSPLIWLIGAAFAPTFAAGSGNFLPPVLGSGFPRISATAPPLAADHVMIRNASAILENLKLPALEGLSDVISRCRQLLYGLPQLDPYLQLRKRPSLGVLGPPAVMAPTATKKRVAAFLDVFCPNIEALLLGLAGTDRIECDLHVSGATAGMLRFLQQQPNLKVWADCEQLIAQTGTMAGLIHHGEPDLVELALMSGLPQLALPFADHQGLVVGNFVWMGCVSKAAASESIADNSGLFRSFVKNASLTVHARHHAAQLQASGVQNALPLFVEEIVGSAPARGVIAAS